MKIEDLLHLIVKCTRSWEGVYRKVFPFSITATSNAYILSAKQQIYLRVSKWLMEQKTFMERIVVYMHRIIEIQ